MVLFFGQTSDDLSLAELPSGRYLTNRRELPHKNVMEHSSKQIAEWLMWGIKGAAFASDERKQPIRDILVVVVDPPAWLTTKGF